jgi:hypothetical protein
VATFFDPAGEGLLARRESKYNAVVTLAAKLDHA